MRSKHRPERRGFLLLGVLFALTGLFTLAMVGLNRSLGESNLSTRELALRQVFQQAEAGLDQALSNPLVYGKPGPTLDGQTFTSTEITQLLCGANGVLNDPGDGQLSSPSTNYTLSVTDNQDADPDPCVDSDGFLRVESSTGGKTIQALVEFPKVTVPAAFNYAAAGGGLYVSGSATLGSGALDGTGRVTIYLADGAEGVYSPMYTVASSTMWVKELQFVNPYNQDLPTLCLRCSDPSVFPTVPGHPAPTFTTSGISPLPEIMIDPAVYYAEAIRQCVAENPTPTLVMREQACRDGSANSWHHITNTSKTTNVNGVFEGVMYIEAGADVMINNPALIKGTVFHEGTSRVVSGRNAITDDGVFKIGANNDLRIDSFAQTDINQDGLFEPPFAPGMAIIGMVLHDWANTGSLNYGSTTDPGIKGFVMATNGSVLASDGTIKGGLIGVTRQTLELELPDVMGPGGPGPWPFRVDAMPQLGGSAHLMHQPLDSAQPGFGGTTSGVTKPTLRFWSSD